MKAAAYAFGIGDGQPPAEYRLMQAIDRYGVRAVLGRDVLTCGELTRMRYTENIRLLCQARERSDNWAEWMNEYDTSGMLRDAENIYYGK